MKKTKNAFIEFLFPKIYSPKGKLELRDYLGGLKRAVITAIATPLIQALKTNTITTDWPVIVSVGSTAFVTFLIFSKMGGTKSTETKPE